MMNTNWNIQEFENVCSSMKRITEQVQKKRQNSPGTMNLMEITNRHHLENQHSNILSFLLDAREKHHHPEYGEAFLAILKNKGLKIQGTKILSVTRENSTEDARRMDLFIQTDKDYIIIENKIYAEDQFRQIADYKDFVEEHYSSSEKVFIVYLTPFGKEPSEKSISTAELNLLKNQNRHISLSYKADILFWLEGLKTRNEEKVLNAGLIQYIDVIKGITNQREEVFNMNQELSKELFNEYGNLTREQLREKMLAVHSFENNIKLVLFINFFGDIYKEANGKILLLCNGRADYKNLDEWKTDVLKLQNRFGVRFTGEGIDKDLFVSDLNAGRFTFAYTTNAEVLDSGFGDKVVDEAYAQAVKPTSWFLNAILAAGEDWEENNGKLSTHVVKNWFGIK